MAMPSSQFEAFVTQMGLRKDVAAALWDADIHTPQELAAMEPVKLREVTNSPLLVNNIHPILQKYVFSITMAKDPFKKAFAVVKKHAQLMEGSDEEPMEMVPGISADSTACDAKPFGNRPTGTTPGPVQQPAASKNNAISYNNSSARMNTTGGMTQTHLGFNTAVVRRPSNPGHNITIAGGNFAQANILGNGPVTYNNTNTVINTTVAAGPDVKKRRAKILNETMFLNGAKVRVADLEWKDHSDYWVNDIQIPHSDIKMYTQHVTAQDVYEVRNHGASRALVLNNIEFRSHGMSTRTGAGMDCRRMEELFQKLGFEVRRENNKTAAEMKELLREFTKSRKNMKADMVVVYIGSHGERDEHGNDTFVGVDGGRVKFNEVKDLFTPQKSPLLYNKPKMFFLQFCRQDNGRTRRAPAAPFGTARYVGSDAMADAIPSVKTDIDPDAQRETRPMDMLCVYATLAGNKAYRDTQDGSWFVTALVRIFMDHADKDDLMSMLTKVNNSVSINEAMEHESRAIQISEVVHNLRKKIFFYPGLEG